MMEQRSNGKEVSETVKKLHSIEGSHALPVLPSDEDFIKAKASGLYKLEAAMAEF